jgi:hypothetical protein
MENLSRRLLHRPASIAIASKNKADIETYVASRLDKMDVIKGAETRELRDEIQDELSNAVAGDFVYSDMLLRQIGAKQLISEIRQILKDAKEGGKRSEVIGNEIK